MASGLWPGAACPGLGSPSLGWTGVVAASEGEPWGGGAPNAVITQARGGGNRLLPPRQGAPEGLHRGSPARPLDEVVTPICGWRRGVQGAAGATWAGSLRQGWGGWQEAGTGRGGWVGTAGWEEPRAQPSLPAVVWAGWEEEGPAWSRQLGSAPCWSWGQRLPGSPSQCCPRLLEGCWGAWVAGSGRARRVPRARRMCTAPYIGPPCD